MNPDMQSYHHLRKDKFECIRQLIIFPTKFFFIRFSSLILLLIAFLVLDNSVEWADIGIHDVSIKAICPAMALREVVIELRGDSSHFRESPTWHIREIVVFVVISDIPANPIQRTVVRVGLVLRLTSRERIENVVLGDEVASNGVEAHA